MNPPKTEKTVSQKNEGDCKITITIVKTFLKTKTLIVTTTRKEGPNGFDEHSDVSEEKNQASSKPPSYFNDTTIEENYEKEKNLNKKIKSIKYDDLTFSESMGMHLLGETNKYRLEKGKKKIYWNEFASDVSLLHSIQMGKKEKGFDHTGFKERVKQLPIPHNRNSENVSKTPSQDSMRDQAEKVMTGWKASPYHDANLVGEFDICGVGAYRGNDGNTYFTQIFLQK